jgi:hypothetical protein
MNFELLKWLPKVHLSNIAATCLIFGGGEAESDAET